MLLFGVVRFLVGTALWLGLALWTVVAALLRTALLGLPWLLWLLLGVLRLLWLLALRLLLFLLGLVESAYVGIGKEVGRTSGVLGLAVFG